MSERLSQLREKANETLRDPETQQRAMDVAERIGGAAVDHVMGEFTKEKRDGTRKIRKLKTARAVLRPVHTARKVAQGTAKAARSEAKLAGKEAITDVAMEQLSGREHGIPVEATEETPTHVPVHAEGHIEDNGTSSWGEPDPWVAQEEDNLHQATPNRSGPEPEDYWGTPEGSNPHTTSSAPTPTDEADPWA